MLDPAERTLIEQLEQRVAELEADVVQLRAGAAPRHQPATTTWPAPATRPAQAGAAADGRWPPPAERRPARTREPIEIDSETVLKWGGVGLVVLAVGFAVSTAITRGWIGPQLQLAGAVLLSGALGGTGVRVRVERPGWTHALCTAGSLALVLTTSSNLFREQAGDRATLIATAGATFVGIALAWFVASQWVAASTMVVGTAAWFAVSDGEPPVIATALWVGTLVAIVLAIALRRSWFATRLVAHSTALVALLAVGARADTTAARAVVLAVAACVIASLAWVPSRGDLTTQWQHIEVQLAAAVGPWALAMICLALEIDSETGVGFVAIGVAAGLALVTVGLRPRLRDPHVVSLLIGASVTLSIGLATLLSTETAIVAIVVQGAGLALLAPMLGRSVRVYVNAMALLVLAAMIVLARTVEGWNDDLPIGDDLAHLAVIAVLGLVGWQTRPPVVRRLAGVAVLALAMVWTGSVLVHLPQGQAVVSVVWAVIGTAVLVTGALRKVQDVGTAGLAVLGVTVGKLLTVDLEQVDTLWRAGLFLLVGLGFLRLGYLLPRMTRGKR